MLSFKSTFLFALLVLVAAAQDAKDEPTSTTTEEQCIDDPNTNCKEMKNYCSNEKYAPLLKQFCPVTCNMCPGATTLEPTTISPNCGDSSSNCKNWAHNGFCTNPFYKCADRKKYCAKTCGLCSPNACK